MATEPNIGAVKIFGYLEKKGKMKVVTTWKKYWFVLEGRLLLYYRSREEYENLSPCKGSINMGLAINIRPGLATAGVLEIITRTSTVTLRAKQRSIQEKWLQALMDASGQQPSVSSTVKMTHFRYSMDNLIPPQTKAAQLTRQNTLPYRSNSANSKQTQNKQIVARLQKIGARTYGGSLDSIVKKTKQNMNEGEEARKGPDTPEEFERNELYGLHDVLIENTEYIATATPQKSDCNKNNLIENEEVEYYCTYEEIQPDLPPRRAEDTRMTREDTRGSLESRPSESDDGSYTKKMSTFSKIAQKFKSFKANNKKKKNYDEPLYDTVNYTEINDVKNDGGESIVKTLMGLKQTLEEKKLKVKDILQSTASKPEETPISKEDDPPTSLTLDLDTSEVKNRPSLPPRSGQKTHTRSPSPFHDTPKNNSPVSPQFPANISLDKILHDLEKEEELNVRQLIQKFSKNEAEPMNDVSLRQKNELTHRMSDDETSTIVNRYSEDLNKLLEELTKVTSAPLMTPGVTSSLIQMKSPPVTDEEWLASTPIRRRRFSDPDYDVPRSHRSLQILAETPDDVIPATRFFGPVLSPPNTETWRSMTPDSLEPAQARTRQHPTAHEDKKPTTTNANDCLSFMDSLEPLSEGATAF